MYSRNRAISLENKKKIWRHMFGEKNNRVCFLRISDGENNSPEDVSLLMDAGMEQFIWNTLGKRKAAHILLG